MSSDSGQVRRRRATLIWIMAFLAALCLGFGPFSIWLLTRGNKNNFYTDVLFAGLLAAGAVVLLMSIALLVALFNSLGLQDGQRPLGLPDGSVSAIIALLLILLFGMISMFVFLDSGYDTYTVKGLTPTQAAQITGTDLIDRSCDDKGCTVIRKAEKDKSVVDIGRQLVTTVSTLVVAISAFYFGSSQRSRRVEGDGVGTGTGSGGVPDSR